MRIIGSAVTFVIVLCWTSHSSNALAQQAKTRSGSVQRTPASPRVPVQTANARTSASAPATPTVASQPVKDDPWVNASGDTMTGTLTLQPSGDKALVIATGSVYKSDYVFLHERGVLCLGLGRDAMPDNYGGLFNVAIGGSAMFSNTLGICNTALGYQGLFLNREGSNNTAVGFSALRDNDPYKSTEGNSNTAIGFAALTSNVTGSGNTGTGERALGFNKSGDYNCAFGDSALWFTTKGDRNTAVGRSALINNTVGNENIAIGASAGSNLTTGSDNVMIGNSGLAGDAATIRIGTEGTHSSTYVAGIRGATTGVADGIGVLIDSNGQLGTMSSSRRFKEDIHDMDEATERLLELRPVVFRFKPEIQRGERPIEYGLIAEEVAEVFPDLVAYDDEGHPFTVKYHLLSSMLLNELQRQDAEITELRQEMEALRNDVVGLLPSSPPRR